jgi:hypothetical protein
MGEDWIAPILLANHGVLLRPLMYLCRREVLRWGNIRVNQDAKSLEFSSPIQFMLEHCTRFGNDGRKVDMEFSKRQIRWRKYGGRA